MRGTSAFGRFRVFHCDETLVVAETGSICVAIWRGAVTTLPFEWQRSGLAEVVERHTHGAGFLCVVEPTAKAPDDELRRASSQMVASHGERLKCVACVIEGEGFVASINRGALASMVLLVRNRKSPMSVFANVQVAARWMAQYIELPAPGDFTAIINDIR